MTDGPRTDGFELSVNWVVGEVGEMDGDELGGRVSPKNVGAKVGVAELGGALTDGCTVVGALVTGAREGNSVSCGVGSIDVPTERARRFPSISPKYRVKPSGDKENSARAFLPQGMVLPPELLQSNFHRRLPSRASLDSTIPLADSM
jgi:hypothetical protein